MENTPFTFDYEANKTSQFMNAAFGVSDDRVEELGNAIMEILKNDESCGDCPKGTQDMGLVIDTLAKKVCKNTNELVLSTFMMNKIIEDNNSPMANLLNRLKADLAYTKEKVKAKSN